MNEARHAGPAQSRVTGFHSDENGDWVAELSCGHNRHMRHDPPWTLRPWVLTAAGRNAFLGTEVQCSQCGQGPKSGNPD